MRTGVEVVAGALLAVAFGLGAVAAQGAEGAGLEVPLRVGLKGSRGLASQR